jgi:hypothetical protein
MDLSFQEQTTETGERIVQWLQHFALVLMETETLATIG